MTDDPQNSPASDFPPGVGAPARRALADAGYRRLEHLAGLREADLLRLHGMGPKALGVLRQGLAAHGLGFAADSASKPESVTPLE